MYFRSIAPDNLGSMVDRDTQSLETITAPNSNVELGAVIFEYEWEAISPQWGKFCTVQQNRLSYISL
jgi:hypothetical protein